MAVTAHASGTLSATVGSSEEFLTSPNVAGVFSLHVNTVNMVAGDIIILRVYQMLLSGDTPEVAYMMRYEGAQPADDRIKISASIGNDLAETNALRFSLNQSHGTSRNFKWKVLKY